MASHPGEQMRGQVACTVVVSPEEVDAGAGMTLEGTVSCSPACDLRGHTLLVKDQAGADAGSVQLTEFDGQTNETGALAVEAPVTPGDYLWLAVCPAVVKQGVSFPEASTPIAFTVKPHTPGVVVWDIPSAIVVGERFRIRVGIKCVHECHLAGSGFAVYDHEGARVATGTLPGDLWPGTSGLYVAEVELEAPAAEGLHTWSVKGHGPDAGIAHAEGSTTFGVRAVGHPQCLVTVEAIDRMSQTPLRSARVVMHPYTAVTDERGVAEVRVARGAYRLFVSQTNYLTFRLPVEVAADMTARAELDLEPVTERN